MPGTFLPVPGALRERVEQCEFVIVHIVDAGVEGPAFVVFVMRVQIDHEESIRRAEDAVNEIIIGERSPDAHR